MDKTLYTEDSIQSVSPREFTRMRPGVYCGSTEYSTQLVRELFSNSLDEHNVGHGNKIDVIIDTKANVYTVSDEGQGILVNKPTEDGRTLLEDVMSVLNTSGKYSDDGVYGGSALGLNGIGAKLACYLSTKCVAVSYDGSGYYELVEFKDGIFTNRQVDRAAPNNKELTGLCIAYSPDPQFFQHKEANVKDLDKLFTEIAALCPSLTIDFTVDGKQTIYHSEKGINELVDKKVGSKEILKTRFEAKQVSGDNLFDIVLTYTSNYSDDITSYVNYGETDSGVHLTAFKTALTRNINKYAKDKKLLKDKDKNLSGEELGEGMVVVFNLKANGVQYDAQSKTRITDIDRTLITKTMNEDFYLWLEQNEKDAKLIIEKALDARKAKAAARKAREAVRNKQEKKRKALKFSSKLADCNGKDRTRCEIYITEGDSASGNLKTARNNEFQAVMPIRGKILNTQKATLDKIQKNAEIMTMIDAFGLTIDIEKMAVTYKPEDLRYGKIIIMSDADVN